MLLLLDPRAEKKKKQHTGIDQSAREKKKVGTDVKTEDAVARW